ncbi:transposase, partial [Mobilicoccus massiliensis]
IRERTALVNRLRWHLHELDPGTEITARGFRQLKAYTLVERQLADKTGIVARLARDLNARARDLTHTIRELEKELQQLTLEHAPALLAIPGCAALTAAKIVGETAGIDRFTTSDAFASYNGTAPLPVWSSNTPRHRLSRTGNRQLNAAIHRIALTQARHHQPAKDLIKRRVESGKSGREALRVLKRHISRTVYQALRTDQQTQLTLAA